MPDDKKESGGKKLSTGGLSASDLRARLGLKSGGRNSPSSHSGSIRARLGLDANPNPAENPAGPATSRIEKSVLDSLKKGLPEKMAPGADGAAKGGESTQALSLDDFEELLVDERPRKEDSVSAALGDVDDALDGLFGGATTAPEDASAIELSIDDVEEMDDVVEEIEDFEEIQEVSAEPEPEPEPAPVVAEAPVVVAPDPVAASPVNTGLEAEDLEGEKTSLLDTSSMFDDDGDFDAFPSDDNTQIMMPAMDYDPLIGKLIVESGEAPQSEFVLARDKTAIGRGTKSDVVIPDIALSRRHCIFERYAEGFVVRDLDSGNGTYVNQRRITYCELRAGDTVELGNIKFRFEQSGGEPEKLWKGAPKIEYHAKDGGVGSQRSAPAAPQGAVPAGQQAPMVAQPQMPMNPSMQQMPAYQQPWATGMHPAAQNPYGQQPGWGQPGYGGYPPGQMPPHMQQRRRGSPVVTAAIIFFSILLLGLVGLILWSLLGQKQEGAETTEEAVDEVSPEEKKKQANELVKKGSQLFDQRRWEDARKSFQEALELDPDNETAKLFVSEFINREQMTEEQIIRAMRDIKTAPTAANYEKALSILSAVDPESTFASEVKNQHLPDVKTAYRKLLVREAQKAISANNLPKAKSDLLKVSNNLGMADDPEVKSLLKQIEIREKKK